MQYATYISLILQTETEPIDQEAARLLRSKLMREYKEIDNLKTFANLNYLAIGTVEHELTTALDQCRESIKEI